MRRLALFCALAISAAAVTAPVHQDYVPDSETAVAITEAVLIPVYGKDIVVSERPYKATLKDGVWTVEGTLHCGDVQPQSTTSPTCEGGVAVVTLSKRDGRILSMVHFK